MQEKTNTQVEEQKKYTYPSGKAEAGKSRLISLGFTAVITIAFWLVATYACTSMGKDYIFIAWFFSIPALVGCWLAMMKLFLNKECFTEKDNKKGLGRMWRSSFLVALLSGVAFCGCLWYLVKGGYPSFVVELGFTIRMGILCAVSAVSMIHHKKKESKLVKVEN